MKNLGKDPPGFISTMDAQITKLGKFNSDLSRFLEDIEARITGECSDSAAYDTSSGSFQRSSDCFEAQSYQQGELPSA